MRLLQTDPIEMDVKNRWNYILNFSLKIEANEPKMCIRDRLIAYFFAAAFFAILFDGKFNDFLVAGLGGIVIFYMAKYANKLKLNNFFINTLGGFLITILSILATKIGIVSSASYSAIGTLMLLVPGLALTNAIRDLINGDLIAGTSRTVEAALVGSALAIGTGFALFAMSYF